MPSPNKVSCGPGRFYYGAKDDSELFIILPPKCWDYNLRDGITDMQLPHSVYVVEQELYQLSYVPSYIKVG